MNSHQKRLVEMSLALVIQEKNTNTATVLYRKKSKENRIKIAPIEM
jgi:hypothetical protein